MNPDTGAKYASIEEGVAMGERPEDLVTIQGRREQVDKIIADLHVADKAKLEKKRQAEKNRRVAAQASRKKNRRKK